VPRSLDLCCTMCCMARLLLLGSGGELPSSLSAIRHFRVQAASFPRLARTAGISVIPVPKWRSIRYNGECLGARSHLLDASVHRRWHGKAIDACAAF
jgi:hypothetical protein